MSQNSVTSYPKLSLSLNAEAIKSLVKSQKIVVRRLKIAKKALLSNNLPEIGIIKSCNTKKSFMDMLLKLSPLWKEIIKFYLVKCFVYDIYNRKMNDKLKLLAKREVLYEAVDNPLVLNFGCHFDNNLVKNFCSGVANYVKHNYARIVEAIRRGDGDNDDESTVVGDERVDLEKRQKELIND